MPDIRLVQGDTRPQLKARLTITRTQQPVDLSSATSVRFQMKQENDRKYTVDAEASIVDAADGRVAYTWGPNDLRAPGTYIAQWEITWAENAKQTTAQPGTIEVRAQ